MALFAGEGAALNAYGAIFVQSEQNNIKIYPMNAIKDAKLRSVLHCVCLTNPFGFPIETLNFFPHIVS